MPGYAFVCCATIRLWACDVLIGVNRQSRVACHRRTPRPDSALIQYLLRNGASKHASHLIAINAPSATIMLYCNVG